jgi:hypothetical protein
MGLELHPLCTLFPRMDGKEFDALKNDIAANGLRSPIVTQDGMILDGGNRYRACLDVGVDPDFIEFDGGNLVSFVLSANLHRRHMSAGQQAAIVSSATDWAKTHKHGGDRKSDQAEAPPLDRVSDRAAISGANERTQRDADKLVKNHPEIAKQVTQGRKSLYSAVKETNPAKVAQAKDWPFVAPDDKKPEAESPFVEPDLIHEIEALERENKQLRMENTSLKVGDTAQEIARLTQEIADWSLKFDQICGRNAQLVTTGNETEKQARYQADLLAKIRKALKVETNAKILSAIQ